MARQNSSSTSWLPVAVVPLVDSALAPAICAAGLAMLLMSIIEPTTVLSDSSSSERPSSARLSAAPNSRAVW